MTIYLSSQDPDGDYYPRIERITDSLGNSATSTTHTFAAGAQLFTGATLTVGQVVTFDCVGNDSRGRLLHWQLISSAGRPSDTGDGEQVELSWTVTPNDTGNETGILIWMKHTEETYHRNPLGNTGWDASMIMYYRVVPPA